MSTNVIRCLSAAAALAGATLVFLACDDTNPPAKPSLKMGTSAGMAIRGGGPTAKALPGAGKSGNGTTLGNVVAPKQSVTMPSGGDPCGGLPDGTAWCGSDTSLAFCSGGASFTVDCGAYASSDTQWTFDKGGYCYETPTQMDCLLCFADKSGANTCCDSSLTICCDDSGACFWPVPG